MAKISCYLKTFYALSNQGLIFLKQDLALPSSPDVSNLPLI